jgi:hypothetical protein
MRGREAFSSAKSRGRQPLVTSTDAIMEENMGKLRLSSAWLHS